MADSKHAMLARYPSDYHTEKMMAAIDEPDEPSRIAIGGPEQTRSYIDFDPTDITDHVAEHTIHARTRVLNYSTHRPSRYIELDEEAV